MTVSARAARSGDNLAARESGFNLRRVTNTLYVAIRNAEG